MPDGISDFGCEAWLSALFGIDAPVSGYYIALCTAEPGVGSDGTILAELEPTDAAYARQPYGVGGANWAVNGNCITNLVEIDFGAPTEDWGAISHYALVSAASDGELYAWGEFLNQEYVTAAFQMVVPPGGIVASLATQDNSITV